MSNVNFNKRLEIFSILFYYVPMKIKCRILSIIGVVILASVSAYFIHVAWARSTADKTISATDIMFDMGVRAFDMYIDNKLILNDESVKLTPENSTLTPEFCVAKYSNKDDTTEIKGWHEFEASGKYLVTGMVWISPVYCLKDYLLVTVVDAPTDNTPVYIKPKSYQIYKGEQTSIDDLLYIKTPNDEVEITSTSGLTVGDGYVVGEIEGKQSLFVQAEYLNIRVFYQLNVNVVERTPLSLNLNHGSERVESLTFHHVQWNQMFTYEVVGSKMQIITCEVEGDAVISVLSYNSPVVVIKTLKLGECKLKIALVDQPNVVFEVKVVVID